MESEIQSQFSRLCDLCEIIDKRIHLRVIKHHTIKPTFPAQLSILVMSQNGFNKWVISSEYKMTGRDKPNLEALSVKAIKDLEDKGFLNAQPG